MKNKIITIYELFGLIKDGKAPIEIKYGDTYTLSKEKDDYENEQTCIFLYNLFSNSKSINDFLEKEIEILEENDEWEDIEELAMLYNGNSQDEIMRNRFIINKLIKNQKYLKERLDKNER